MARPSATWRSAIYSTSNSASPYTGSTAYTPAANSLIVVFVCNTATTPADPTSVSAHGVSLTQVGSVLALSTTHKLSLWVGNAGASPTNAAASATISGTPTGCVVDEFEVTNWNTGGTALEAILRVLTNTGTATSGSVSLPLAPQTVNENDWISFFVHLANETSTGQGGNWTATAGGTGNFNTPATSAIGQDNDTALTATATASWTTSSAYAAMVVEIRGTTTLTPSDSLKVTDSVTARLDPIQTEVAAESLKVADQAALRGLDPLLVTVTAEGLKVADQAADRGLELSRTVTAENLLLDDIGQGNAQLLGALKISDTVTAALVDLGGGDLSRDVDAESLKVSDGPVAGQLDPLEPTAILTDGLKVVDQAPVRQLDPLEATAALQEALKVSDVEAENNAQIFEDEILKISDSVQAALIAAGELSATVDAENLKVADQTPVRQLDPLQTTAALSESLKVADQAPSQQLDPLQVAVTQEGLKVADQTASGQLDPLQQAAGPENLKVSDTVTPAIERSAALQESLKLSDSASGQIDPLQATAALQEALKLSDAPLTTLDPLQASPGENLKISDTAQASTAQGAEVGESLKISDTVQVGLDLSASLTDSLKIADQAPIAQKGFRAALEDSLKVTDTAQAALQLAVSVDTESLKISDAVTVASGTLFGAPGTDSLKVSDAVQAALDGTAASVSETLKVSDSAQAVIQLGRALADEGLTVSDQVTVGLTLVVVLAEGLAVSDAVEASLPVLEVALEEGLKISESLSRRIGATIQASYVVEFMVVKAPGRWVVVPAQGRRIQT